MGECMPGVRGVAGSARRYFVPGQVPDRREPAQVTPGAFIAVGLAAVVGRLSGAFLRAREEGRG